MLGVALKGIPRDSYRLMSKVTTREGVNPREKIDELRKLANTDYFDVMLMHYQHVATWPADTVRWRPEAEPPTEVRALLGRWWSEGNEFVFTWEKGRLNARAVGAPSWMQPSVFEAVDGGYRVATGRERGERLRVDGDRLIWAGYVFTRTQEPFASDASG